MKEICTLVAIIIATSVSAQWKQYNPNKNNDPANASKELINPANHTLLHIEYESQMAFAVESNLIYKKRNNIDLISALSKSYEISNVVTTVAEKSFNGILFPEVREFFQMIANTSIEQYLIVGKRVV